MGDDDFKVGFRKPPKHSQFQPGQSGNPRGRPKGARNLKTELEEELQERIPIKEGGQQKRVSKQRAMIKALTAKAVQGDTKAANVVIGMVYRLLGDEIEKPEVEELTKTDQAILEEFTNEILNSQKTTPHATIKRRSKNHGE